MLQSSKYKNIARFETLLVTLMFMSDWLIPPQASLTKNLGGINQRFPKAAKLRRICTQRQCCVAKGLHRLGTPSVNSYSYLTKTLASYVQLFRKQIRELSLFPKIKRLSKETLLMNVPVTFFSLNSLCTRVQAPVVQKLDSAIHRINHYPVDKG